MNQLGQLLLVVLAALTVENVFFFQGMGFYELLRGAKKGKNITAYAALLTLFSAGSGMITHGLAPFIPTEKRVWVFLLAAGVVLAWYLVVCLVLVMAFPHMYRRGKLVHWPCGYQYRGVFYSFFSGTAAMECLGSVGLFFGDRNPLLAHCVGDDRASSQVS